MDEFHFYGDQERGAAWQIPLITMPQTLFLMMSATLGDTEHITTRLKPGFSGRDVVVIANHERPVPLTFNYSEVSLQTTIEGLVTAGEAPIYLVNFTQRDCCEQAQNISSINIITKEIKKQIADRIQEVHFASPYGKELHRLLRSGIGVHHAGLLPKYRLLVEKLAQTGVLAVVSGTDSLGVGVNVPIRTVVFHALSKFDGEKSRLLSARQFHQIAGRAGRMGFDDHGNVVVQAPEHSIENKQIATKIAKNPHLKNKLKPKKPPTRGYIHWDKSIFDRLVASPPEPLEPHFEVNHGMIVTALQSDQDQKRGGYGRIVTMIQRSHLNAGQKRFQLRRAATLFRSLRQATIVGVVPHPTTGKRFARVKPGLQPDFSLHQSLSLYLIEALPLVDPYSETYALDILSFVEAILEHPTAILYRQLDKIKEELIAKWKAEGIPYEERIERLEQVEYLKPNADVIYASFNAFAQYHPWLDGENIRPKSVAREMFEKCLDFNDYILFLGAARSEGVLLRYLSQVYKTAYQNVPKSYWNEQYEDILAYLRTMIRRVDSSLLDEWETMVHGAPITSPSYPEPLPQPARPVDPSVDFKSFTSRIRSELFLLLKAVADKDYSRACTMIRQTEENSWNEERFEQALALYYNQHASIDTTPRARSPQHTFIREIGRKQWQFQHKIIDPMEEEDWAIIGIVDLRELPQDETQPLIELQRIGI